MTRPWYDQPFKFHAVIFLLILVVFGVLDLWRNNTPRRVWTRGDVVLPERERKP